MAFVLRILGVPLREQKRRKAVAKFAGKRKALFEIINDAKASDEDRAEARVKLEPRFKPDRRRSIVRRRRRVPAGRDLILAGH